MKTIQSLIIVWFDEAEPQPGTQVLEVVVTARAYEGVLSILREVRGSNTFRQARLQHSRNELPSTHLSAWRMDRLSFYWQDEVLGETTPDPACLRERDIGRSAVFRGFAEEPTDGAREREETQQIPEYPQHGCARRSARNGELLHDRQTD